MTARLHPARGDDSATRAAGTASVSEIMTRCPVTIDPDASVASARLLMLEHGVGALPVILGDRVVGLLSSFDVLRDPPEHSDQGPFPAPDDRADDRSDADEVLGLHIEVVLEPTVSEVMTPWVFALPSDALVGQAATLMASERIHHVPVVGARGELLGIVSALDIARAVAGAWDGGRSGDR